MIRRVTEHKKQNFDGEKLIIVTIYEDGIRKRDTRNQFSKKHKFLVKRRNRFKLIEEKA